MLALVHQELGVELSLKDLFQSPTVEGLAQVIASAEKGQPQVSARQRNKIRILFLHRKTDVRASAA